MSKKETKELSVDEHNADLYAEIKELELEIVRLKKLFKSESLKKQATLQECLAMNKKAVEPIAVMAQAKPKTNSL